jgi:hypothetical protein
VVIMGCGHEDAMHTLKKRFENRRSGVSVCRLLHQAPRRLARTRRAASPCQSPAMPNGRCRMHGGKSPGAPVGNKNALKHGRYTAETIARRRSIAELIRTARQLGM